MNGPVEKRLNYGNKLSCNKVLVYDVVSKKVGNHQLKNRSKKLVWKGYYKTHVSMKSQNNS